MDAAGLLRARWCARSTFGQCALADADPFRRLGPAVRLHADALPRVEASESHLPRHALAYLDVCRGGDRGGGGHSAGRVLDSAVVQLDQAAHARSEPVDRTGGRRAVRLELPLSGT